MHALPSILGLGCALLLAPATLKALADGGHTRLNYRQRALPSPFGVLALIAALAALIPLAALAQLASADVFHPEQTPVLVYALGVLALGLIDDTLGERSRAVEPRTFHRGLRGHAAAAMRGELSTGVVKALGSLGLALFATSQLGLPHGRWLLAVGVLVLATHVFNLLDLRPGRAAKAFLALAAGLLIGTADVRPLWVLGLFAAPALVAGAYDLRERAMLGDTGAGLLGALAGFWLVLALSQTGQLVALAALAAITVYGELRSISALVERTPGLRQLDCWGRP